MADTVRILERPASNSGRASLDASTEINLSWKLSGSDDLETLTDALDAVAPATLPDPVWSRTLVRANVSWSRLGGVGTGSVYEFTIAYIDPVQYDERRQLDTGESRFSFSTTGGTLHIVTGLGVSASYTAAGVSATPYSTLIGVTDEGVEGVDIAIPVMSFQIEYRHPKAVITHAFRRTLGAMTATVNNSTFYTHPAGEVLYMGADGSQGTKSDPQLTHQFLHSPNLTGQVIGGITGIAKKGHEYVSVYYETFPDTTAKRKAKREIQVDVHELYEGSDFSVLGIGTA